MFSLKEDLRFNFNRILKDTFVTEYFVIINFIHKVAV